MGRNESNQTKKAMCYSNATMLFQLEEQLAVFIQAQSKRKDMQYRMEVTWEKERDEQKRLLKEAHDLTLDLQVSSGNVLYIGQTHRTLVLTSGVFYVRRKVDLMKTAKVNAYIMHIFGKIELLSIHAT